VREHPEQMERWNVQWTPTVLVVRPDGKEHHRIEGFLEADDFLAQLLIGLGQAALAEKRWSDAERSFAEVLERYPDADAAPEAQYWRGVARYKASSDPADLHATAQAFQERYRDSVWAKKASIWA
jgi:uncharacterized protein HemY